MKKSAAFYLVITMGLFLLTGQAYAMGGGRGDGKSQGSIMGDQQMTATMQQNMGNGGQQGAMRGTGHQQEAMHGAMPQGMMQGGAAAGNGGRHGRMGSDNDATAQSPATPKAQ